MKAQPGAIIILGMHRSGTSLLAKVVHSLGVRMGPEEHMLHPREDNPEGFWELAPIVDFHERLLHALSSSWDTTKPLPGGWWDRQELSPYRTELKQLIEQYMPSGRLWAFKDPRTCLTLPLWQSVLGELGIAARYVIGVRNPLDVAASLEKRDHFTREKSFACWTLHTAASLYYTQGKERMIVPYDYMLGNVADSIAMIGQFIGLEPESSTISATQSAVNPALRHGQSTLGDLHREVQATRLTKELYSRCLGAASEPGLMQEERFAAFIHEAYRQLEDALLLTNHEASVRMRIYWPGSDGTYTEQKSAYCTMAESEEAATYRITVDDVIGPELRIDPFHGIGFMKLTKLLVHSGGRTINLLKDYPRREFGIVRLNESPDVIVGVSSCNHPSIVFGKLPPIGKRNVIEIGISVSYRLQQEMTPIFIHYEGTFSKIRRWLSRIVTRHAKLDKRTI